MQRLLGLIIALIFSSVGLAGPQVTDSIGREVTLAKPAETIIGLAPHIVENLFSAGAGDKLIGVVNYSDHPVQARSIPQVGSAYAWSLETVVAMDPDLVVLWGSGNGTAARSQLERLGIKVYVSEPRELEDIADSIRDFGVLAGTEAEAELNATAFENTIEELSVLHQNQLPLTVFYQIWNKPLATS
jgi:iron complex transport system substrate-binding protein